jgi:ribosome-associated heat shock protein Hsp15
MAEGGSDGAIRLDLWLWHARLCKTRALGARLAEGGRVRVNGQPTAKAHRLVRPDDVLTFPLAGRVRVLRVLAPGTRRGPAAEARALYDDLDPPAASAPDVTG